MGKQYHFRPSPNGFFAWDVDRLVKLSSQLQPTKIKLEDISELDEAFWFGGEEGDKPTVRAILVHVRLIVEADLDHSIILSSNGRVMDGMHRVAKAVLRGHDSIKAVQFEQDPEPDYVDVYPEELAY